jgi:hypothetical protein
MQDLQNLDPLSEMMVLSSYKNTKNLIITAIELKGILDEEALDAAVQKAATRFPQFLSRIRELRESGKFYLAWKHDPTGRVPFTVLEASGEGALQSPLVRCLRSIRPILDRNRNLFDEFPAEMCLFRISRDHVIFVPVIHHVAADGGTASEFGRELLANYHESMTGRRPDWAASTPAIAGARKRLVALKQRSWRDILKESREAINNVREKATFPQGKGHRDDATQHQVKKLLSVEETENVAKQCTRKGHSLVDVLVAAVNLATDQWNAMRNVPSGILTTSLSVNMKGRFEHFCKFNNSGLIFFKSSPDQRLNLSAYTRSIALTRIRHFRNHMDYQFFRNVSKMTSALRILPFSARRRVVNFLMQRHQFSLAVTLLGAIWPEVRNGKPTANTCFSRTGDVDITEVHGMGYKLLSNTPLLLIVYTYKNQLNFMLAASGFLFTREESEQFLDLIVGQVLDFTDVFR